MVRFLKDLPTDASHCSGRIAVTALDLIDQPDDAGTSVLVTRLPVEASGDPGSSIDATKRNLASASPRAHHDSCNKLSLLVMHIFTF